jgi:hypothetical protein
MDIVERLRGAPIVMTENGYTSISKMGGAMLNEAADEIERLREVLKELLNVIPNFPSDGNFLVGMKERYNQALIEARAAFQQKESE